MLSKNIFVYGTLKSGLWNHGLIERDPDSKLVTIGVTQEEMYFCNAGVPFMIRQDMVPEPTKKDHLAPVIGEVWEINNQLTMNRLDQLEGHPHAYVRMPLVVCDYMTGTPYGCEGYFYPHSRTLTLPNYFREDNAYHYYPEKVMYDYRDYPEYITKSKIPQPAD